MPKKLPGVTLEFVLSTDEGRVESGHVRAPAAQLPIKAMRAVRKALVRLSRPDMPTLETPKVG